MNNQVGFEYRNNKEGETAFEIFLRYSDEKEKSAAVLRKILSRTLVRQGMMLLDVGSGNGEYLRLALCGALNTVNNERLNPTDIDTLQDGSF